MKLVSLLRHGRKWRIAISDVSTPRSGIIRSDVKIPSCSSSTLTDLKRSVVQPSWRTQ
jgi:hypothetical protein